MAQSGPSIAAVELQQGGPGTPPQPWIVVGGVVGGALSYDGAIIVPSNVAGGPQGPGTMNINDLYIKGVRLQNLVGGFLPLSGGTLTGPLIISGPNNLQIGMGQAGETLSSDGAGNTYWANVPPGGPYLLISGGTLTGPLILSDDTSLLIGGGNPGQVLQTDGNSNLTWVNPGGAGSLPPAGTAGYLLATDGAETPYWTADLPGGPYAPAITGGYLPLSGGALTGALILAADPTVALGATTKQYSDTKVMKAGDTMTGPLTLSGDPTAALQPTTKQYVDNKTFGTNRIINGDMTNDQRNSGAAGTTIGYTADRWSISATQTKGTWQRVAGPVSLGFPYCWQYNVTSAYTQLAGDYFNLLQAIEAVNISDFAWGTAGAMPVTLSFYVISSVPGIYTGVLRNGATNRSYPFSYNIAAANVWQQVIITIPGDTAGTWVLNNNTVGLYLLLCFGIGTTYAGPFGGWASANYVGGIGQTNLIAVNGASISFTGIKLEIGSIATPFAMETYSKKFSDCLRYYWSIAGYILGLTTPNTAWSSQPTIIFPTAMRANPTMQSASFTASSGNPGTPSVGAVSAKSISINNNANNWTQGSFAATINLTASFNAEL